MRITTNLNIYTTNPCDIYEYRTGNDYVVNLDGVLNSNNELYKGDILYYPNPVTDVLNLRYAGLINRVEVYNIVGQMVLTQNADAGNVIINTESLANGIYSVRIFARDSVEIFKIIKK